MLLETRLYSCMLLVIFNVAVCFMLGFTKLDFLENGFFSISTGRIVMKLKEKINQINYVRKHLRCNIEATY